MSFAKLRAFQLNLYNIPLVGEFLRRHAKSRGDNGSEGMGAQCKGLGHIVSDGQTQVHIVRLALNPIYSPNSCTPRAVCSDEKSTGLGVRRSEF